MVFTKKYYHLAYVIAISMVLTFIGVQVALNGWNNPWQIVFNLTIIIGQGAMLLLPITLGIRAFNKHKDKDIVGTIEPSQEITEIVGTGGSKITFLCGILLASLQLIERDYLDACNLICIFAMLAMIVRLTSVGSTYARIHQHSIVLPIGSIPVEQIESYRIQNCRGENQKYCLVQFKVNKMIALKFVTGIYPHLYVSEENKDKLEEVFEGIGIKRE